MKSTGKGLNNKNMDLNIRRLRVRMLRVRRVMIRRLGGWVRVRVSRVLHAL